MAVDAYLGEITMFAGKFAPRGWAFCDGQVVEIKQYPALFSVLGYSFGGERDKTFALPSLRGCMPMGARPGGDRFSVRGLGRAGGSEPVRLGLNNLPGHDHRVQVIAGSEAADSITPAGHVFATGASPAYATQVGPNQGAEAGLTGVHGRQDPEPLDLQNPYLCVSFIICADGAYPPRD